MATTTTTRPSPSSRPRDDTVRPAKRKKEARTDIWSSLLRQTREAQARSRTQTLQHRDLLVCGGSADAQHAFVHALARPPPPQPPGRNAAGAQTKQRPRGEVKLANRFAYGYGHVTLFSPPQQSASGMGMLGGEAEEVARVQCHCFPGEAVGGFEHTLRRLFGEEDGREDVEQTDADGAEEEGRSRRRQPSVALLLSWKEPWLFLEQLRRWLQLLARAVLPAGEAARMDDPMDVLKEAGLHVTVVAQHVEAQEGLEREDYKEDTFDFISQHLRTCILPLAAGLVYTSSSNPPQQPGAPLTELQKVLFTSLDLDLNVLSPKSTGRPSSSGGATSKKDELGPKHNVVDRMAIVVPSGWDSLGKIRLLSETFSPESVMEGWSSDLDVPLFASAAVPAQEQSSAPDKSEEETERQQQANGGAEVYESASPAPASPMAESPPMSPSKQAKSAIKAYEQSIQDPSAHKRPASPKIETTTKPEQQFLAEMRTQLQKFEQQDAERQRRDPGSVSTTAGSVRSGSSADKERKEGQSGALEELGDVAFNVGGVSYNAVSAEAAIERLKKRPSQQQQPSSSSPAPESPAPAGGLSTPRQATPRPPKREQREAGAREDGTGTPQTGSSGKPGDMNIDQLEQYFASLMKRGGGSGTPGGTPSRGPSSGA